MRRLRLLLGFLFVLMLAPVNALATTPGATAIADPPTVTDWRNWGLDDSTQNVGRIWTDKTVSADDIELTGAGGTTTIKKGDSDFLTAFSAISSTSNLSMTSTTPLDIVLVLDASGSMDDPMGRNDSTKRIGALKAAANSFIDEIAKKNDGISNADQRHRVAVVKFAGDETDQIGNSTYQDGRFTYNYSQTMKALTACTSSDASQLKDTVNSIRPAGATRADNGLSQASRCFSEPRSGAKKVVVFFTDGTPTSNRDFESGVASSAIASAKALKDAGATVYSVGIFEGANPSAEVSANGTSNENKFMQAVSSNYPDATYTSEWWGGWSWDFGTRATDAGFYKSASSAADLKDVFDSISQEIAKNAGYPTHVTEGMEDRSGYVTFTEQLGDYMQVDGFNYIVFANNIFSGPDKVTDENDDTYIDTYTFHGTAGTALYPNGNLDGVIIRVERSKTARTGDRVTVSIPASLIPLRHFAVDEDAKTGSVTLTFPIRVFFGSSLKDGVPGLLAHPDADMSGYISSHTSDDGTVSFLASAYSNSNGTDGDTTASFTPAVGNGYYYITEDSPLYADKACTIRARGPLDAAETYYYKRDFYKIENDDATLDSSVAEFKGGVAEGVTGAIDTDDAGYLILKKGSPRLTYITELHSNKAQNITETATSFRKPLWTSENTSINVLLGNNGRLSLPLPGALEITKSIELPEGFDAADYAADEFEFSVSVPQAAEKTLTATVTNGSGQVQGDKNFPVTFSAEGIYSHKIKPGEKLTITGLESGWTYTVSETPRTGWTTKSEGETGAIAAGKTASAKFRNAYAAKGTLSGSTSLLVAKTLKGRAWDSDDKFAFVLTAIDGAPLPDGAADGKFVMTLTAPEGTPADTPFVFNLGDISYTRPGTYEYNIVEARAGDGYDVNIKPGVSVSQALYRVTVTVSDEDHDGKLKVESVMVCLKDDEGAAFDQAPAVDRAAFTNVFDLKEAKWDLRGTKHYEDKTGTRPLKRGMFRFELKGINGAPMPADAENDTAVASVDGTGRFAFEQVTFDDDDINKTYQYELREVNDGQRGVKYDGTVWDITVSVDLGEDGKTTVYSARSVRHGSGSTESELVTFDNSYEATPATTADPIGGDKTLTGRSGLDGEEFSFAMRQTSGPSDGASWPSSGTTIAAGAEDSARAFDFGNITFTRAGTYEFEISEVVPATPAGGMTYDGHVCVVTVEVRDTGGALAVDSVTYSDGDKAHFTNKYAPTQVSYYPGLTVSKVLTGRTMKQGEFSFTITGKDATAELGTSAATAAEADALLSSGDKSFSNVQQRASGIAEDMQKLTGLVFDASNAGKTYAFEVAEVVPQEGGLPGVTYDKRPHELVIAVIDNLDGTLSITTKIDRVVAEEARKITFENTYRADEAHVATADLGLTKTLEGRDWRKGDAFTFSLTPVENAPLPVDGDGTPVSSVTVGRDDVANGVANINFGTISFSSAGQYEYEISEVVPVTPAGGISYSTNVVRFRVTVRDDVEKGELVATTRFLGESRSFVNRYDSTLPEDQAVTPTFTKVLEGRDWMDGDEFTFEIVAKTLGAPMPVDAQGNVVSTVRVDASNAAGFSFGTIPLSYDLVRDGAKTYVYKVHELPSGKRGITDDTRVATVTVTVADEGNGNMSATVVNENNTFKNVYRSELDYSAAGGLSVGKVLAGRDMKANEFGFTVKSVGDGDKLGIAGSYGNAAASDGAWALVARTAAGVTFTQQDVGKTYAYKIAENGGKLGGVAYDGTTYRVSITTSDNPVTAALTVTTTITGSDGSEHTFVYGGDSKADPATVTFHNSYDAAGETPVIAGTKTMTNGLMLDGDFSFRLAYARGDQDVVATATNKKCAVSFGTLRYDLAGLAKLVSSGRATRSGNTWEIPYVAYEVTDGLDKRGVTPVAWSFPVVVKVEDKADGTLACTVNAKSDLAFSNTYATGDPVEVTLVGQKVLDVPEGLSGTDIADKFTFTVTPLNGGPSPEHTTARNGENGEVDFGTIQFTLKDLNRALDESGEPSTQQEELDADAADGGADDTPADAEKAVPVEPVPGEETDSEDSANPASPDSESEDSEPEVEGGAAEDENAPTVSDGSFDADSEPTLSTAAWRASRPMLRLVSDVAENAADASQTRERSYVFSYDITETGSVSGVTNDSQPKRTVRFKVTDDGLGNLTVSRVDENGKLVSGPAFTFTNSYDVTHTLSSVTDQIEVHKTLKGRALAAGEFTFDLIENGKVVVSGTNDAAGSVRLDAITYERPGTHHYEIREHNIGATIDGITYSSATYHVTTVVEDKGDGTLRVTHTLDESEPAEFVNEYHANPTTLSLTATKVLEGGSLAANQFSFRLEGSDVSLSATNDALGQVTFRELRFTQVGTYTFDLYEVNDGQTGIAYDSAVRKIVVTVEDDGWGNLIAHTSYASGSPVFRNVCEKTPETPATTPTSGKPLRQIPQTGDELSLVLPAVLSVVGVALVVAAVVGRKRR